MNDWKSRILKRLKLVGADINIPEGISAKEIYEDLVSSNSPVLDKLTWVWLAGEIFGGDIKEMYESELKDLLTMAIRERTSLIVRFLLLRMAEENYNKALQSLERFPDASLTKLRVKRVSVDLEAMLPKPDILLGIRQSPGNTVDITSTHKLWHMSMDSLELEYYEMHKLLYEARNTIQSSRDVYVFENLLKQEIAYIAVNMAILEDVSTDDVTSVLSKLYCLFLSCKVMQFQRVNVLETLILYLTRSKDNHKMVFFLLILAAWSAGIEILSLPNYSSIRSSIIEEYDLSETPKEFIYKCCTKHFELDPFIVEFVFDHEKALTITLGIPAGMLRLDPNVNLEDLHGDMDILLSVENSDKKATKSALNKLLRGEKLDQQVAEDLFFFAGENGCDTIMNILHDDAHIAQEGVIV